jgi:uncharacterized protein
MLKPAAEKTASERNQQMKKPGYFSKGFGFFILSVIFLWGVCAWILLSIKTPTPHCGEKYHQDKVIAVNGHGLLAQTAKTPKEQEQGLSGRACLGKDQAMLFIFDKPGYYPFWMKNMKFSIDIAWISADKHIVDIQENVSPQSSPKAFVNTKPARYVIELQAGQADSLGLQSGNSINF